MRAWWSSKAGAHSFSTWKQSRQNGGSKLFLHCNSNVYLQEFIVYLGKKMQLESSSGHRIYFDIVDQLTRTLRGKYHVVYMDNLYSSVPLFLHLFNKKLYACGTLHANRKFLPPPMCKKKEFSFNGVAPKFTRVNCVRTWRVLCARHKTSAFPRNKCKSFVGNPCNPQDLTCAHTSNPTIDCKLVCTQLRGCWLLRFVESDIPSWAKQQEDVEIPILFFF